MIGRLKNWHNGLTTAGKVLVWSVTTIVVGGVISASANPSPNSGQTNNSSVNTAPAQSVEEKKSVIETQAIPFAKTSINDPSIESGKTVTRTAGANGTKSLVYEVTYRNGVEMNRTLVREEVTTAPTNEVIAVGTYVAPPPQSSYTSTTAQSSGVRTGATCKDGSHSNATGSGACSHHGGVAVWLYN